MMKDFPHLYLDGCSVIAGDRDALVTLRSAINEALRRGRGTADLVDGDLEDVQVVVLRLGV
jgi:hypothetical protein